MIPVPRSPQSLKLISDENLFAASFRPHRRTATLTSRGPKLIALVLITVVVAAGLGYWLIGPRCPLRSRTPQLCKPRSCQCLCGRVRVQLPLQCSLQLQRRLYGSTSSPQSQSATTYRYSSQPRPNRMFSRYGNSKGSQMRSIRLL